jgi:hypothetical protein
MSEIEYRLQEIEDALSIYKAKFPKPILCLDNQNIRQIRYGKPAQLHFVYLTSIRILSNLKACKHLISEGFVFESMAMIRVLYENTIILDYFTSGIGDDFFIDDQSLTMVAHFFEDIERPEESSFQYPRFVTMRKKISKVALKRIASFNASAIEEEGFSEGVHTELLKNLYSMCGNYVHGKYPETMIMFDNPNLEFSIPASARDMDILGIKKLYCEFMDSAEKSIKMAFIYTIGTNIRSEPIKVRNWLFDNVFT